MLELIATGARYPVSKGASTQTRRAAEFNQGRTYERYSGEHARARVTGEAAAAGGVAAGAAAGAGSLSGAKLAGTPLGQSVLGGVEAKMRMSHKTSGLAAHKHAADQVARYKRYGAWAGRNRLKATGGIVGASALAGGARIAQRVRQNEEAGISQGIGRMKAGEGYTRTTNRVKKSGVTTAALISDLHAAGPKTRKALSWSLDNRGKLVRTGLGATGVAGGVTGARMASNHRREARALRTELRSVTKGGRAFAVAGALTGAGGFTASRELHGRGKDEASQRALAGTVGGWAGQGAYQAAGYGPKHMVLHAEKKAIKNGAGKPQPRVVRGKPTPPPPMTKSRLSREQGKHAKLHGGKGSVEYYRTYPSHLPGHRANRVLGWTHRGKTGTALGAAATGIGSLAASEYVSGKKPVKKALYQREDRLSALRTAQMAGGLGLAAWGVGRSSFLGAALARGARMAAGKNSTAAVDAMHLAMAAQGALRRGTAPAERQLRQIRRVNAAINKVPNAVRPEVAGVAGLIIAGNSRPLHRTTYRQVSTPVRVVGGSW